MFLKQVFKKSTAEKKPYYLIGDLNINCLEYFENEKVSTFYNSLFECGAIALINKPTRVAKKSATSIGNVITTNNFNESLKKRHYQIQSKLMQNSSPLKNYYASLLNKYKYNTKQTWQVMKEITGKEKKIPVLYLKL